MQLSAVTHTDLIINNSTTHYNFVKSSIPTVLCFYVFICLVKRGSEGKPKGRTKRKKSTNTAISRTRTRWNMTPIIYIKLKTNIQLKTMQTPPRKLGVN